MGSERREYREIDKKQLRQAFAENWSIIGYRYVVFDRGVRRLLWFILLVAATIFSVYLFYGTLRSFFNYETYIQSSINYSSKKLNFPTITFCNLNPMNMKRAQKMGIVDSVADFNTIYSGVNRKSEANEDDAAEKAALDLWMRKNDINTFQEAINKLEMSYDDMTDNALAKIIRSDTCSFDNTRCNRTDIRDTMSWEHSLCHQFNSFTKQNQPKTARSVGITTGLEIYLNIESNEKLSSSFPYYGMEIIIHPFGTPHYLQKYNDVIFVQPGTMNAISIEAKKSLYAKIETIEIYDWSRPVLKIKSLLWQCVRINKVTLLPVPYKTACRPEQYKIIQHYPYSKAMCEVDCILQKVVAKCKCVGFEFQGFSGNVSVCTIGEMKCYNYWKDYYRLHMLERCSDGCPLACSHTKYSMRMSQATLGNPRVYQDLLNHHGFNRSYAKDYIEENIVAFKISFSGLQLHESQLTPAATWTNVLGEIGGNLGLCMGLSILTVFELIFFIYDYICILCGCRQKKVMKDADDTKTGTLANQVGAIHLADVS